MGAGGMGALFGAILHEGGLAATLVDIDRDHVDCIRRDGLRIVGFGGDRKVNIPAATDTGEIDEADVVLFQCKAHGTIAAAEAAKHLIERGAVAISFQNGLGNEEMIGSVVGMENVLGGLTTMAGCLEAPGVVRDFSRVPSYIGEMGGGLSERAEHIAAAFTDAGLETHATANVVRDIWMKLLGNIAMSAASGATNLTSASLLTIPELKALSIRAMDEAQAVAASVGVALDRDETLRGMEAISAPGGTGDNKSSLCVDILNRRPTEVDYIYGSVIARARDNGVATPTLDTLLAIVKGLESHYMERADLYD
jgi:2-dehydropantoate 2-reductase